MSGWVRVNFVLLVLVIVSAVFLVNTQYHARQTFMDADKAAQQERSLEAERDTLEVEKREAASNSKIERVASDKLGMHTSPAGSIRYVRVSPQERHP